MNKLKFWIISMIPAFAILIWGWVANGIIDRVVELSFGLILLIKYFPPLLIGSSIAYVSNYFYPVTPNKKMAFIASTPSILTFLIYYMVVHVYSRISINNILEDVGFSIINLCWFYLPMSAIISLLVSSSSRFGTVWSGK